VLVDHVDRASVGGVDAEVRRSGLVEHLRQHLVAPEQADGLPEDLFS
jgi:hypothetical protein